MSVAHVARGLVVCLAATTLARAEVPAEPPRPVPASARPLVRRGDGGPADEPNRGGLCAADVERPRRVSAHIEAVFATIGQGLTRVLRDQAVVEGKLPAATRCLTVDGVRGWLYPVVSELGDAFELFVWFDGGAYQVKVAAPDLEGRTDPHACHLFPDGRLCLGEEAGGGMPTLESAYAKSVLWCSGFSVYLRTARFPF